MSSGILGEASLAINKRKILQSAQKHMQKGALDKALKDYMSLLKADPKDVNIRLKVGDIHLKQGQTEEAVAAYEKVAQFFMRDGFDAKAVALYKQITKIDPKRVSVYEPLAELYQRLGLTSDAMSALQTAADAHYRAGAKDEALDLLRKMASLEPSNTTSRLKVADLLRQEGRNDEAVAEFQEVANELERQGDAEERARVLERILEIRADHAETLEALGRCRLAMRDHERAEAVALRFVEQLPDELAGYQLLEQVVEAASKVGSHVAHFRKMAELLKARGDDAEARTVMQRFVASGGLGGDASGEPVLETDDELALETGGMEGDLGAMSPEFADPGYTGQEGLRIGEAIEPDGAFDDTPLPRESSGSSLPPLPKLSLDEDASDADAGGEAEAAEPGTDEPFDAEQVLAEAGVYLRYGKHARAVETLRGILAREPAHRGALEKLGEALVASGEPENAARAFERAAAQARDDGDADAFEALRTRLAELDPSAAEALAPDDEPEIEIDPGLDDEPDASDATGGDVEAHDAGASDVETLESGETLASGDSDLETLASGGSDVETLASGGSDIEFEIDVDEATDTAGAPDGEEATETAGAPDADEAAFELDADAALDGAEEPLSDTRVDAVASGATEEPFELSDDGADEATGDEDAFDLDVDVEIDPGVEATPRAEAPQASEEQGGSSTSSSTTPAQIVEELEEAEFFFQQGMHAEARAVYERILEVAPSHPQAMLRLGELDAAASQEAAATPEPAGAEAGSEGADADDALGFPGEGLEDLAFDEEDTDSVPATGGAADVTAPFGEPDADADAGFDRGASLEPEEAPAGSAPEPPAPAAVPEPAAATADAGDFDLAAELSDAFDEDDTLGDTGPRTGTTEEEGFEQVFAAFKAGVKKELGEGDYEAHYDLGIAYKEMGLLEDAIGEFTTAVGSPAHRLACLHMMALCALDLGRATDAVANLEQALSLPDLPQEQEVALRFDLGSAYAAQGDTDRARAAFEAVAAVDPEFREVGAQIEALASGAMAPSSHEEEEAFESFDDLLDESDAEAAEPEAEAAPSYESFDDLMEDETEPPVAEAAVEAEPEPEPEPAVAEPVEAPSADEAPEPDGEPRPGRRRRKKISFV